MAAEALPETEAVYWRPRVTPERLRRRERIWTLYTLGHVVPFLVTAALLLVVEPQSAPIAAICLVHAWILPALYAQRGANVLLPRPGADPAAERMAAGLLGDLVSHDNRDRGPDRPPAAGAARRRGRVRHRGQPRVQWRDVAGAPPDTRAGARGTRRRGEDDTLNPGPAGQRQGALATAPWWP